MSIDIERAIHDSTGDIELATPAAAIIARGDRLKSRRRRTAGVAAAGVLSLLAVGGTAVLPGSGSLNAPAVAAFSGPSTNLTGPQLQDLTDACTDAYRGDPDVPAETSSWIWDISPDATPVAAEIRGDVALAYFAEDGRWGTCSLTLEGDRFFVRGQNAGRSHDLADGHHLAVQAIGTADLPGAIGQARSSAVLRVSPEVATVEMTVGGETTEAFVDNGLAFAWSSGAHSTAEADAITFAAYDSEGDLLEDTGRTDGR